MEGNIFLSSRHFNCLVSYREVLGRVRTFADKFKFTEMASAVAKEKASSTRAYCSKKAENSLEVNSFDFIKEQIKEENIKSLVCDVLSKFCAKLQLKTKQSTKEVLIERLSPLQDDALIDKKIILINKFSFRRHYQGKAFLQQQPAGNLTFHSFPRSDKAK